MSKIHILQEMYLVLREKFPDQTPHPGDSWEVVQRKIGANHVMKEMAQYINDISTPTYVTEEDKQELSVYDN